MKIRALHTNPKNRGAFQLSRRLPEGPVHTFRNFHSVPKDETAAPDCLQHCLPRRVPPSRKKNSTPRKHHHQPTRSRRPCIASTRGEIELSCALGKCLQSSVEFPQFSSQKPSPTTAVTANPKPSVRSVEMQISDAVSRAVYVAVDSHSDRSPLP